MLEDSFIDLKTVPCPINFVRAKLLIDTLKKGQVLKIQLDLGEKLESVLTSMQEEGHKILTCEKFPDFAEIYVEKN